MDEIPYDIAALENNIKQCDENIKTYEGIIDQEFERKKELQRLVRLCEERDANKD